MRYTDVLDTADYPAFKKALLDSACTRCRLSASRAQIVVDRGNPAAKVLIIGEAPGKNEDLQGKAFVGRAGRLLDRLMKDVGFDTNQDSLIVNVVKCRPPKNRAPLPEETARCIPFLKKQIELVKPRIILLLGKTAVKHVIPERADDAMADAVGNFFKHPNYPGMELMILFHPAYLLRDPRKTPLMAEHLNRFKDLWGSVI